MLIPKIKTVGAPKFRKGLGNMRGIVENFRKINPRALKE